MQYRNDKYGNPLSVLGFGCMRFAKKGNAIDMEQAEKQIMAAYKAGVNQSGQSIHVQGKQKTVLIICNEKILTQLRIF